MDFCLSAEQQALQDSVRRFCEREYAFERRQALLKTTLGFNRAHWAAFADLGWLGAGVPEEAGGYGGGAVENMLLLEQMARALVVEPFLSSAVMATQAIVAQAHADQRDSLLTPLIGGEKLAALAHYETSLQGLGTRVETRAEKTGSGYTLAGRKCFVLGGPSADWLLVSARTRGEDGDRDGVSLFVCPADTDGLTQLDYHAVDGRRVADLILKDVKLGPELLIGAQDTALDAVELALDHGVVGLCAEAVGATEAALWLTRDYLKTRKQFGVALSTFQALQHRMADMLVETELARSMLYRGMGALALADPAARARGVSAAKAQIGEAGFFVGTQAVQLHGGIGVTEEYIVGHYFKRLSFVRGFLGSTDQHVTRFVQSAPAGDAVSMALV